MTDIPMTPEEELANLRQRVADLENAAALQQRVADLEAVVGQFLSDPRATRMGRGGPAANAAADARANRVIQRGAGAAPPPPA